MTCLGEACRAALRVEYPTISKEFPPNRLQINYAKIKNMKAIIRPPVHESYKRHRKEVAWKIILPVVVAAILIVGLIVLVNVATFRGNGDVGRWAAIATMWIAIPVMVAGLIFLIILGGIVYLLKYLLNITPVYTGKAQDFVYRIAGYIRRIADAVVKPVIVLDGIGASMKKLVGRK